MKDNRLEEAKKFTPQDLVDIKTYDFLLMTADDYVNDFMVGEAKELYFLLSKLVNKNKVLINRPGLTEKYEIILTKLSWLALPFLSNKEIEDNFKLKLIFGIKLLQEDLIDRVKSFFTLAFGNINLLEIRRRLILNSISENEEIIGTRDLTIEGETVRLKPTIGNWLKDYNQSSDTAKRGQKLSIVEYFSNSKNISQLSKDQIAILRLIFDLYDLLRFLPEIASVQETGHVLPEKIGFLQDQPEENSPVVKEDIKEVKSVSSEENEIIKAYQGDPRQAKALQKEEEKISKKIGDNLVGLRAEFFKAVQDRNINRTIALLRILAKQKDIENFLKEDAKLNKFLSAIWEKQYGKGFVAEFNKKPDQLKFVRHFLRYVLEQRLGLQTSDAARVGLQIGNIFVSLGKRSYNKMAYFDVKEKVFKWFEN